MTAANLKRSSVPLTPAPDLHLAISDIGAHPPFKNARR